MGILDIFNVQQGPHSKDMRYRAGMDSLGLLGGSLMAAGAPTTDPGHYGRTMAQGFAQMGPAQQASLDRQMQMAEYQRQQEMRDALPGILADAELPPEVAALAAYAPEAAVGGLLNNALNPVDPRGEIIEGADGYNYYANTGERVLSDVIAPVDPFMPEIETYNRDGVTVSGYFDQSGQWVDMGTSPQWKPDGPDAPDYANFSNGQSIISVDLSTPEGQSQARDLTASGYFSIGTSVNAATLGGLGSGSPGPVGTDGSAIDPGTDYYWSPAEGVDSPDPTNMADWQKTPIPGTETAREVEGAAEAADAKNRLAIEKANNVISVVDDALGKVNDQPWYAPTTGVGGSLMSNVPGSAAYQLEAATTTIKANLGFDALQAMRDASPTGGALGQVAIQELEALQAALANLDPGQGEEAMRSNLQKVRDHYTRLIDVINEGAALEAGAGLGAQDNDPLGIRQ